MPLEIKFKRNLDGTTDVYARTLWGWHYKVFMSNFQFSAIMQAIECGAENVSQWPGYSE